MIVPVAAISASTVASLTTAPVAGPPQAGRFANMLLNGVNQVNRQVAEADHLAEAFALDDSVPLHQVTFAMEQARMSVELMLQVRSRLIEGYQELMRMQL